MSEIGFFSLENIRKFCLANISDIIEIQLKLKDGKYAQTLSSEHFFIISL